jgi:predicted permease
VYQEFAAGSAVFSGVIARASMVADLTWQQQTERVSLELVSRNYFDVLGVSPAAGRFFSPRADNGADAPRIAVLSYSYWARRFRSDPAVVGQTIVLNQVPARIEGVSARGLHSLIPDISPDVIVPMEMAQALAPASAELFSRRLAWMNIVGRLRPGMTRERAEAELAPQYRRILEEEARQASASWTKRTQFLAKRLELIPAGRGIGRHVDEILAILIAIMACALITAYANLAGLCVARVAARQRELAIRAALGAGRARMAGQLLSEFLLPVAVGGIPGAIAGIVLAGAVPGLLFAPEQARTFSSPDWGVMVAALAIVSAAAVAFGAVPALLPLLGQKLRILATGNIVPGGLRHGKFWKVLVTAQVTIAAMLMYGAFTFSGFWLKKTRVDHGPGTVVTFAVDTSSRRYSAAQAGSLFQHLEAKLSATPGVHGVGFAAGAISGFEIEGLTTKSAEANRFQWMVISPGYFKAGGFSFAEGGSFDATAGPKSIPHVCVNEAFRRRAFGNRSALGKHVRISGDSTWSVVTGVVRDFESNSGRPLVYHPYYGGAAAVAYLVRGDQTPEALCGVVKALIDREAPGVRLDEPKTIEAVVAEDSRVNSVMAGILVVFGGLTMALAAIGVYGVTAYLVARRTSEIGVRMALGASARKVVAMVMKEIAWTGVVGAFLGIILAVLGSRVVAPVNGPDFRYEYPLLVSGAAAAALAALAAGLLAARRAAHIEPTLALRCE